MAKTPKVKKREVSIHSRAARRAASPTKDLAGKGPIEEVEYKPWLHNPQNAGISKKQKNKQLTRQQRLRQQRGLAKADANSDKLEKKVEDSKSRGRRINARRIDWEALNGKTAQHEVAGEQPKEKTAQNLSAPVNQGDPLMGLTEDVTLPDVEQPLPVRSTESMTAEHQLTAPLEAQDEPEEIDEIT